jgi:hypothetical protein
MPCKLHRVARAKNVIRVCGRVWMDDHWTRTTGNIFVRTSTKYLDRASPYVSYSPPPWRWGSFGMRVPCSVGSNHQNQTRHHIIFCLQLCFNSRDFWSSGVHPEFMQRSSHDYNTSAFHWSRLVQVLKRMVVSLSTCGTVKICRMSEHLVASRSVSCTLHFQELLA